MLEPIKCKSLSISSGRSKDITFKLSSYDITSIKHSPEKFFDSLISSSGSQKDNSSYVINAINETLFDTESLPIRDEYV